MKFLAIDFETANENRNSACSVGLVLIDGNSIVQQAAHLIKPPTPHFTFSHIHGLKWDDVKNAPSFEKLWPVIFPTFIGIDFLVAHNAPFDKSVLLACCKQHNIIFPNINWECSLKLSRKQWPQLPSHKLPDVCKHLSIPLNHHEALSDALACARITWVLKNQKNQRK